MIDGPSGQVLRTLTGDDADTSSLVGVSDFMILLFTTDGSGVSRGWNVTWHECESALTKIIKIIGFDHFKFKA